MQQHDGMTENNQGALNNSLRKKSNFSADDYVAAKARLRRLANVPAEQKMHARPPNAVSTRKPETSNNKKQSGGGGGDDGQVNSVEQIR
jgi:hypothetical protein